MSNFFSTLWSELQDLLSLFVTVALLQNVILTTGFAYGAQTQEHLAL